MDKEMRVPERPVEVMEKSFKIITLGCKVNQYESAYLKDALARAGWRQAVNGEGADVSVVNTCIVTQKAGHQSRQEIRKAIRGNPKGIVAAIGCYAQVFPDELRQIEGIGLIADNTVKGKIPELLLTLADSRQQMTALNDFKPGMPFDFLQIKSFPDRTRAYLKIQDGCQSFCSFCIVAFARGPYRSLAPEKVLSMIESLTDQGYKEVVLTGIHLGKYGVDLEGEMNLKKLLHAIGKEGFPVRLRLSSLEPNEIDAGLMEMVAAEPWLCRHFHIPLQSGDDGILRRMNRHYNTREFSELIESIHDRIPLAAIGVDVMAGFPGEDIVAHKNTCALIKDLPVSYLHVFPFSCRPGTAAASFDGQIDPGVIKERAEKLRDIGLIKRTSFYHNCLGKEFQVLAERWHSKEKKIMKGLSDNYLPVLFSSSKDSRNQIIPVHMERVENNMVVGSAM
ncbi:MAG: tRNA (N(6)-L-threonylcarbamoyladenosine(37)-C(2))-methylthiotransferase MtaB [Desulfobacteraceae bacterium]|nr:tRNA (N(6)-L-threonylcarbamoyladenosine(37)-C(2))-methylthiotransferase MtaB [Desulfobacteraceae bacterium]